MWASFSWSCVIDPINGPKVCKSIDNFLTNWAEDGAVRPGDGFARINFKLRNRNEAEKIRFFIQSFCLLFKLYIINSMLFYLGSFILLRYHDTYA
jgi:hypothetical protein